MLEVIYQRESINGDNMSTDLFNKIQRTFGEYAVDKRLAYQLDLTKLPRYVSEYLISKFIYENPCNWQDRLRSFIRENYYEPEQKELVKHNLSKDGKLQLIDELKIYVDLESNNHIGVIESLNIIALIPQDIADRYKQTMITGLWGLIKLQYTQMDNNHTILITDFEPFQAPDMDVNILNEARKNFALDEWLDVIINTIGLDHTQYNFNQKLLITSRLVPLIENNVNIMDFGPRATGKTFIYRNASNYVRLISGGNITSATLFYNLKTRMPGELAMKDCIVFDEVSKVKFNNPDEMMGKLKDYMESGHYEKGDKKVTSDSSLVFMGNVQVEKRDTAYIPVEDLTYVLPEVMRDSAFIDRIHALLPGWLLPKIQQSKYHLSKGYGIASDYFAEYMHVMRKDTLSVKLSNEIEFSENLTIRDEKAVKRVLSGLVKLLFPHGSYDNSELKKLTDYTVNLRQYVRDWLHKIAPGEFMLERLYVYLKDIR